MDAHEAASILGVHPGAPLADVRAAYLRAARAAHPDLAPPGARADAEAAFKRVGLAYARLTAAGGGAPVAWATAAARAGGAAGPSRATSFSNVAIALALSVPLAFAGVTVARSSTARGGGVTGVAAAVGRPDGLWQPPVNEFLADGRRARTAPPRWSRWSRWGWGPADPLPKGEASRGG